MSGPDEFATRHELGLIVRFLVTQLQKQAEATANLIAMLISKGIVGPEMLSELTSLIRESESRTKAAHALSELREYAEIRDLLRRLEELPPEE